MSSKETIFEKAKKHYPRLWDIDRINTLFKEGVLTEEEYNQIIGREAGESISE